MDADADGLCVGDGSFMNVRIKLNVNKDHIHIERSYCIFCNMISQYEYDLYLRSIFFRPIRMDYFLDKANLKNCT